MSKLTLDTIATVAIVTAIIAVCARTYQLMNLIDSKSGFYFDHSDFTIIFLNAVLVISVVAIFCMSFLSAKLPPAVFPKKKDNLLAIAGLIMSAGMLIDAMHQVAVFINAKNTISAASFSKFITESRMLPHLLQIVTALASVLYLLIFALSYLRGKNSFSKLKLFALMPSAWMICRIVTRFTREANYRKDTELFFELATICFAMVFFFMFSRIASGIANKGKMWLLYSTGLITAIFSSMISLPRLVMMLIGRADLLVVTSPLEYADLIVPVFIVLLLSVVGTYYSKGLYEGVSEDDPYFNEIPDNSELLPVEDTVPDSYRAQREEDEAFRIASQYSDKSAENERETILNGISSYDDKVEKKDDFFSNEYKKEKEGGIPVSTPKEPKKDEKVSFIDELSDIPAVQNNNQKKNKKKK